MDRPQNPAPDRSQPRLLDQVREVIRRLRGSIGTEQVYVDRIRKWILFRGKRHPEELGAVAEEPLTALAVKSNVASPVQNHARTPS
jgi:hypothetical protein